MLSIGAYVRLSPTNEERVSSESGSLVSHPKRLEEYVESRNRLTKGWGKICDFYVDKDFSGKDTNRPELQRLLRDIIRGEITAVLVTELSRLSRNTFDFLKIWQIFERHNVQFISLREQFDTTTAAGRMMLLNMVNFAQFEREQTIERIRANNRSRAKQGMAAASQKHVLGYDPHPEIPGSLVPSPNEAPQVKAIFETFLEKGSVQAAVEDLFARGFRTKEYTSKSGGKRGGKRITANSLMKILTNHVYLGEREINKRNRFKDQSALPAHERYEAGKAIWPAILSAQLFEEVEKRLRENFHFLRHALGDHTVYPYVLTGLAVCGDCGENLAGRSAKGRSGLYHYYSHRPRRREETKCSCPVKRVRVEKVEKAVIGRLQLLAKDEDLVRRLVVEANARAGKAGQDNRELLVAVQAELEAVSRKSETLLDRLSELPKGHAAQAIYQKLENLGERKTQLETRVAELKAGSKCGRVIDATRVFSMIRMASKGFGQLPPEVQKVALRNIVAKVEVRRNQLVLVYHTDEAPLEGGPDDKPRNRSLAARGLSVPSFGGVGDCSNKTAQLRDTIEFQALAVPEPEALSAAYVDQELSTRQVASALGCAKSTVQRAVTATGIAPRTRRKRAAEDQLGTYHVGQLPFGAKTVGTAIVKHVGEQRVIATMRKLRAEGASFGTIAQHLNERGVRTKNGMKWHHATVARVFRRSVSSA